MSTVASQRPERRIALVPGESGRQAMQLVESMLWAFQGTMRSNWVAVKSADAADVLVVGAAADDSRVKDWKARGKPVIVIVVGDQPVPSGDHVLVYPFRATQLLQLLNALDTKLHVPADGKPPAAAPAAPASKSTGREAWSFVEALRTLREVQNSEVWLAASQGSAPVLWIKGDGSEYATDIGTLQEIRRGTFSFSALRLRQSPPPAHRSFRPCAELAWFAGYHASTELAPWLDPNAQFRVTRWPNFGLIRPIPSQIRITALLTAGALKIDEITRRTSIVRVEAIRTLNALEASNVLAVAEGAPAAPKRASASGPQPPGGLSAFLRLVRKHLGLS